MAVGIKTEVLYSDEFGYSKLGFWVFEVLLRNTFKPEKI